MLKVYDMSINTEGKFHLNPIVMASKNETKEDAYRACELIRSNRNLVMAIDNMEYACDAYGWVAAWFEGDEVFSQRFEDFRDDFVKGF